MPGNTLQALTSDPFINILIRLVSYLDHQEVTLVRHGVPLTSAPRTVSAPVAVEVVHRLEATLRVPFQYLVVVLRPW